MNPQRKNHFLTVCTGNTCRSPLAEAYLRHLSKGGCEAKSAGISAFAGLPYAENSLRILAEEGIGLRGQSKPLTHELVEWADIILCMTSLHKQAVIDRFPEASNKTRTLSEWAGLPRGEISDPVGADLLTYRGTAQEIRALIEKGLQNPLPE